MRKKFGSALAGLGVVALMGLTAVSAQAADPLAGFHAQRLAWKPCSGENLEGLECSSVAVPMDYVNPGGGRITIAISRHRATDQKKRRGVLVTNPGGPGGDGLWLAGDFKKQPIAQAYDIIGMDPRGIGESTQLHCVESAMDPEVMSRPDEAQLPLWGAWARDIEENCRKGGGAFREHVTTANTARDIDLIRVVLGERKINYLGYSYGTFLGAVYGAMFPRNLDRSVFDSAMDPTKTWHQQNQDSVGAMRANFDAWASWTAARNTTFKVGATAAAVRGNVDRIAAAMGVKPFGGFEDQTTFDNVFGVLTQFRVAWSGLSTSLGTLLAQLDGAPADAAVAQDNRDAVALITAARKGIKPTYPGAYEAITCEWAWPRNAESYYSDMRKLRDSFPYGFAVRLAAPTNCAFRTDQRPGRLPAIKRAQYPVGLVVQGEGDPQTAYGNGEVMAEVVGHSLISVSNEGGHGQYNMDNACVDAKVNAYLLDGVLPGSRVVCATANPPADVPADKTSAPLAAAPAKASPSLSANVKKVTDRMHTRPIG